MLPITHQYLLFLAYPRKTNPVVRKTTFAYYLTLSSSRTQGKTNPFGRKKEIFHYLLNSLLFVYTRYRSLLYSSHCIIIKRSKCPRVLHVFLKLAIAVIVLPITHQYLLFLAYPRKTNPVARKTTFDYLFNSLLLAYPRKNQPFRPNKKKITIY